MKDDIIKIKQGIGVMEQLPQDSYKYEQKTIKDMAEMFKRPEFRENLEIITKGWNQIVNLNSFNPLDHEQTK